MGMLTFNAVGGPAQGTAGSGTGYGATSVRLRVAATSRITRASATAARHAP